jgi:hypothetical protein
MTALASAGIGTPRSMLIVILAWVPSGSIELILPTFTPDTRTSSPA